MSIATRRITALLISLACLSTLLFTTGCGNKKETLNIYTWEGIFPQELLDNFTKKTGIKINYANFDTDETMLAKLQASGGADYDFVICDDYIVPKAIEEGLVSELDRTKISTWGNINPAFQGQYYDKDDKYTVPCGAGIMEIIYKPSATGFELKGYTDLWDNRLAGKVGIIANPRVINGIVLKLNGQSFNVTDTEEIRKVSEKLTKLAPNIKLVKDSYLNDDLVSGEIAAALVYTSIAVSACLSDSEIKTVLPEEGLGFGIMPGFIPSKAPNKDAAYKFIEYLNEPEVAAQWFSFMGYYDTNKASEQYLDPSIKSLITMPDNIKKEDMEMIENIPDDVYAVHEEVWTDFINKLS